MLVKTLRPHQNAFGKTFRKDYGDEYDLPDADAVALIADGIVTSDLNAKPKRRRKAHAEDDEG